MANEDIYVGASNNDLFYEFEGSGGLSGVGRFNVGYSYNTSRKLKGALRFPSVYIPNSKNLAGANVHMYVESREGNKEIFAKIWGIDEDNTNDFSSYPMGRTKTSNSNTHSYSETGSGGFFTIGVENIVEEIVARGGWASGNAMGFLVEDNGTSTSDPGGYIYETWGGTKSFLEIRLDAEPNFKPTPLSVNAPTFPPLDHFGVKISYPGYNVLDASETELFLTTRKRRFKVIDEGLINTSAGVTYNIAHGLSYKPFARAFFKSPSSSKRYKIPRFLPGEIQDPDADTTDGKIEVDGTNVKITTTNACEVYYYIYIDELAT